MATGISSVIGEPIDYQKNKEDAKLFDKHLDLSIPKSRNSLNSQESIDVKLSKMKIQKSPLQINLEQEVFSMP